MPAQMEDRDLAHPDRKTIQSLFNTISPKYDFLNSFLSLGLHHYWRMRLVRESLSGLEQSILDIGVGTGKSMKSFLKKHRFRRAVGCDFSEPMLQRAKERLGSSASYVNCDFHEIPFHDQTFDLATGSFILRSVQDMGLFLSEIKRVLKSGGKIAFLELTRPRQSTVWNLIYKPYLKLWVPLVGRLFTRHDHAYEFLSRSIQTFASPEDIKAQMLKMGFRDVTFIPVSFGISTIIRGVR